MKLGVRAIVWRVPEPRTYALSWTINSQKMEAAAPLILTSKLVVGNQEGS